MFDARDLLRLLLDVAAITRTEIQPYLRSDLREVRDEKRSLMPRFGPDVLNESELDDLLSYLATLRGPAPSTTAFTLPAIPR